MRTRFAVAAVCALGIALALSRGGSEVIAQTQQPCDFLTGGGYILTIGGPSKYPCGRGVMLASLHSSRQIAHLLLERRDAWLEITRLHYASLQLIADKRTHLFPAWPRA